MDASLLASFTKKTVIRHPRMHFNPFQSQFCIATTQNSSETRFTRYSHTCMYIVHRQTDTLVLLWLRLRKWLRRGVSKTGVGRGCRMCCWDNSYHLNHPDAIQKLPRLEVNLKIKEPKRAKRSKWISVYFSKSVKKIPPQALFQPPLPSSNGTTRGNFFAEKAVSFTILTFKWIFNNNIDSCYSSMLFWCMFWYIVVKYDLILMLQYGSYSPRNCHNPWQVIPTPHLLQNDKCQFESWTSLPGGSLLSYSFPQEHFPF